MEGVVLPHVALRITTGERAVDLGIGSRHRVDIGPRHTRQRQGGELRLEQRPGQAQLGEARRGHRRYRNTSIVEHDQGALGDKLADSLPDGRRAHPELDRHAAQGNGPTWNEPSGNDGFPQLAIDTLLRGLALDLRIRGQPGRCCCHRPLLSTQVRSHSGGSVSLRQIVITKLDGAPI